MDVRVQSYEQLNHNKNWSIKTSDFAKDKNNSAFLFYHFKPPKVHLFLDFVVYSYRRNGKKQVDWLVKCVQPRMYRSNKCMTLLDASLMCF